MHRELARFRRYLQKHAKGLLRGDAPVVVARAPGRIDVMGGIADYCGSVVLEGTLGVGAWVAAQARRDDRVEVVSREASAEGFDAHVSLHLADLFPGRKRDYEAVRAFFRARPRQRWAGYLAGNISVLAAERRSRFPHGVTLILASDVPVGAGVSSSAAIEVAAMCAILALYRLELDGLELARLCQIVENRVVGAPCGIMDQVTCALGKAGMLLALKCQPHELLGFHGLPHGVQIVGINSKVKHAVGGSRYTRARVGAFMGLKIISDYLGHDPYGGYLANVTPQEFRTRFRDLLPARITGREFLERFGETDDPVTHIDPRTVYAVRACASHPVYENQRVQEFIRLIGQARETGADEPLVKAGRLMYGSHWSYGHNCALGASETDLLVRLAKQHGPRKGIFGAKITGGGCGGTVVVLARDDARANQALDQMAAAYQAQTHIAPELFRGTSAGALEAGTQSVCLRNW